MNLEHVSAGKSLGHPFEPPPKANQIPLLPQRIARSTYRVSHHHIERTLQKLSARGLCGKEEVQGYLRSKLRHNCKPNTIRSNSSTILLFLEFFKQNGGRHLSAIGTEHISAFVEHEQDRGLAPVSVEGRLNGLYAFLNYLVKHDVVGSDVLRRKLRIKVPQALPRAIDPDDVKLLLAVVKKPRDCALILTLLRTGMRIGELLNTKVQDINLREQYVLIIEADKNRVGRAVYLSSDATAALRKWMKIKKCNSEYLFYGRHAGPLGYEAARAVFNHCLVKAGLAHKCYTLHCLRHTYASELLNAGMPLQCLQELLGHKSIEMTRRYARLTDNTRREAYYKAMAVIEAGEINGHYRLDYQLP